MNTPAPHTPAAQFLTKLQADSALKDRLAAANPKSLSELGAAVIALGAEQGVTLTLPELETWLRARSPAVAPEGELSDAQLEAVAGGGKGPFDAAIDGINSVFYDWTS